MRCLIMHLLFLKFIAFKMSFYGIYLILKFFTDFELGRLKNVGLKDPNGSKKQVVISYEINRIFLNDTDFSY